jgi:hypothetical protein
MATRTLSSYSLSRDANCQPPFSFLHSIYLAALQRVSRHGEFLQTNCVCVLRVYARVCEYICLEAPSVITPYATHSEWRRYFFGKFRAYSHALSPKHYRNQTVHPREETIAYRIRSIECPESKYIYQYDWKGAWIVIKCLQAVILHCAQGVTSCGSRTGQSCRSSSTPSSIYLMFV